MGWGVGWGVKTYTFLQAGRIGQGGEIGVWMGPRIRTLGRNPPHERSRGTQTTFRWASSKAHLLGNPDSCHFHPRFIPFSSGISLKIQIHAIFTPDSCHFHTASARGSGFMPFSSGITQHLRDRLHFLHFLHFRYSALSCGIVAARR